MKKVIELIRVSTDMQAKEDRAGIPAQRAENRRTATRFGLQIVKTIEFSDVSGADVRLSPEIKELERLIQNPDIHGVVAKEFSRLMRLESFHDYALLQSFVDSNTILYLPEGPIDLTNKMGKLLGTMRAAFAGLERSEILERTWSAKEAKRRAGQCPQSHITLPHACGYSKEQGWFYKPEVEKVREAFHQVLSGNTNYNELAKMVGVTPRGMHLVLRNPIFCGWKVYDKKRDSSARGKYIQVDGRQSDRRKITRSPEEVIRVKVIQDAIITEAEFARVQEIMDRKQLLHWRTQNRPHRFTYNGFLVCSQCSSVIHTALSRDDYYVCKGRKQGTCDTRLMRRDVLDAKLDLLFSKHLTSRMFIDRLYKEWNSRKGAANRSSRITEEIKTLQDKRKRIADAYFDGMIRREDYEARTKLVDASIAASQGMLLREHPLATVPANQLAKLFRVFSGWKQMNREQKRSVLAGCVSEIRVANYAVDGMAILGFSFSNEDTHLDAGYFVTENAMYLQISNLAV